MLRRLDKAYQRFFAKTGGIPVTKSVGVVCMIFYRSLAYLIQNNAHCAII
jgi:hypothetical protein